MIDDDYMITSVENICNLLETRSYSELLVGEYNTELLEGNEWRRVGEAICSNDNNFIGQSPYIQLYLLNSYLFMCSVHCYYYRLTLCYVWSCRNWSLIVVNQGTLSCPIYQW